jgi:hypothetical protein
LYIKIIIYINIPKFNFFIDSTVLQNPANQHFVVAHFSCKQCDFDPSYFHGISGAVTMKFGWHTFFHRWHRRIPIGLYESANVFQDSSDFSLPLSKTGILVVLRELFSCAVDSEI